MNRTPYLLAAVLIAAAPPGTASALQPDVPGTVWVANEYGHSVSAIDATTNTVRMTIEGIDTPHNLQVSPDGLGVWVVSGHTDTAVMLDARTGEVHGTAPTGDSPAHVVVSPDGTTAYVTNGGDGTITMIDVASMQPTGTIAVGDGPHGLRPSPDGDRLLVANAGGTSVSLVDIGTGSVTPIEVGSKPVQVAWAPDGRVGYVTLNGDDGLAVIDTEGATRTATVPVGDGPVQVYLTPSGDRALVANQGTEAEPSSSLTVVDTTTLRAISEVATGLGAHGVVVEPTGRLAYVTDIYGDSVTIVDLSTSEAAATISVGDGPNGVSWSPESIDPAAPRTIDAELMGDDGMEDDMEHG